MVSLTGMKYLPELHVWPSSWIPKQQHYAHVCEEHFTSCPNWGYPATSSQWLSLIIWECQEDVRMPGGCDSSSGHHLSSQLGQSESWVSLITYRVRSEALEGLEPGRNLLAQTGELILNVGIWVQLMIAVEYLCLPCWACRLQLIPAQMAFCYQNKTWCVHMCVCLHVLTWIKRMHSSPKDRENSFSHLESESHLSDWNWYENNSHRLNSRWQFFQWVGM